MPDDQRVDELLEELLESGGTPEEVCRACPELLARVRAGWQRLRAVEAEVGALFPESSTLAGAGGGGGPGSLPQIPGYDVQGELGRGGMGVVYKAWHGRLNRPVALKMLLAGPYARPQELERFLREAEAVAGLRHANVVQVYDAGDLDGRPYFTMEFVEGGSLSQKLAGTPQPAARAAALVATIARAVHAAHRHGIVHRDLTPSNILLTADGTPKVTDFGLARRLGGSGSLTLSGAPLGTPSYMAPEQARGEREAVGPATDVYALGGILYEMLTGRPPFRSETVTATLRQVMTQDPVPPSRVNHNVPRDLETICLKCLHKEPQRRYASAAALAEDLQRFERGEPISARPVGCPERVAKWARRRPAVAVVLVASFLTAAGLAGNLLWRAWQQAETERAVEEDLREVARLQETSSWDRAMAVVDRADVRLAGGGRAELRRRVDQLAAELKLAMWLDGIRMNRTPLVDGHFSRTPVDRGYGEAFRDAGLAEVHDDPESVAARVRASAVHRALVAALDNWAVCAADTGRQDWLLEVARRADPDPGGWRDRVREPATWRKLPALAELAEAAPVEGQPVQLLVAVAERLQFLGGDATKFLERVQKEHPGDFWVNFLLGNALARKEPRDAVGYYRAALAVRPGAVVACNNLAFALKAAGQLDKAIDCYKQAVRTDPEYAPAYSNLGVALKAKGRYAEAIDCYRQAVRVDPRFGLAHNNLANALRGSGQLAEAIDHYEEAIRLVPRSPGFHYNLALALDARGQPDDAIDHYRQALRIDPKMSEAHDNLGILLTDTGRPDEAIEHFREALRINPGWVLTHNAMGEALLAGGRCREARDAFRRCLDLLPPAHARRAAVQKLLQTAEQKLALEGRLPALLEGEYEPASDAERLQFAELCLAKKQSYAAARLYRAALAGTPRLADSPGTGHRYNAARAAALAGCGVGSDGAKLTEEERAYWRGQARAWLRADLDARAGELETAPAADRPRVLQTLARWLAHRDLAGLRDPNALEKLPPAERQECRTLWDGVDARIRRARDPE